MDQEIEKHESSDDDSDLTENNINADMTWWQSLITCLVLLVLGGIIIVALWFAGNWVWDGIVWVWDAVIGWVFSGGGDPYRSFNDCYDKYPNNKVLYQLCVDSR